MNVHFQKRVLNQETKTILSKAANTIRHLSIDAVEKANSGHPGLPLGCAELGAYLYGCLLRHNPKNPDWINRDRFILSAGHGSIWLYSCLHLSGFGISLEEIKNFRQFGSHTPGHPEAFGAPGVETTTGPLGQGVGNAVGQALGLKLLADRFNTSEYPLIDSKVYALVGDGCIMEGVSAEVSSLAGHLNLNNLIVIYDANKISLDGPLSESCSEDTVMRYRAYGWDVHEIDGYNFDQMHETFCKIREHQERPCLVVMHTTIGKGSPHKAGSHKVHGSPLGREEAKETKVALGLPEGDFVIPKSVQTFFETKGKQYQEQELTWQKKFELWKKEYPDKAEEWKKRTEKTLPENLEDDLQKLEIKSPIAGRKASHAVIQYLATQLPQLVGGSADLSCSDMTLIDDSSAVSAVDCSGRNIKFGVREFGMATMSIGMAQVDMFTPFVGTFLVFSDYMRNAIRLAALGRVPMVFQFTHDSIFVGEDGPTHQPVEHFASLRAMPNLRFIRPADSNEVKMAWIAALNYLGPTAMALSRQSLPELKATKCSYAEGVGRGAYIVHEEKEQTLNYTLFATGSEVSLALNVAVELEKRGKVVRVVSVPCWELFEEQDKEYKNKIVGGNIGKRVSIEAGVELGWHKFIGLDGIAISVDQFGASAPGSVLAREYGFTVESVLEVIL